MVDENKIQLGDQVRDMVTGFTGTATARIVFLNGCVRYCITPKVDKDGKIQEGIYIDVEQLEIISKPSTQRQSRPSGGGDNPPPRSVPPAR